MGELQSAGRKLNDQPTLTEQLNVPLQIACFCCTREFTDCHPRI